MSHMPYNNNKELPNNVRIYGTKVQSQWRHVFNSVYKKTEGDEARAFRGANSILKKRFKGSKSMENNSRGDYMNHLIDTFLGNLEG